MTDKYEFIDAGYATVATDTAAAPTVMRMCEWLQISKSGFYEWRSRPESATAKRREMLKTKIRALFKANDSTYGYRRMHAALARGGEQAGPELVRALMRELGLVPCQPRPWRPSTTRQGAAGPIPDLVRPDFSAARPGEKMVGDITYIPTWQGWVYLATVIDCATRKITGWAMDDNYRTPLITAAIEMAARNMDLPSGAIFHSDRGSNYTSAEFGAVLESLGIRQSVGRTGICYDNALAMHWQSQSMRRSRLSWLTGPPTRRRRKRRKILRSTLSSGTIGLVSTRDSGTGLRKRVLDEYLNQQAAA